MQIISSQNSEVLEPELAAKRLIVIERRATISISWSSA